MIDVINDVRRNKEKDKNKNEIIIIIITQLDMNMFISFIGTSYLRHMIYRLLN